MDVPLALQPCQLSAEAMREPLPFDLYTEQGTLLSKRGCRFNGHGAALLSQALYRTRLASEHDEGAALHTLERLFRRYEQLTESWSCRVDDVLALKSLAAELTALCGSHSDICVGMAAYLPGDSHATRHCFAAAIVSVLLGGALAWNAKRLHTVALAAMTMNLSLLSSHDDWRRLRGPLSGLQQGNVQRHPSLSADLLAQSPGVDMRWIVAVDQHHENLDGSGYPLGLQGREIVAEARVLRIADAWCALVLHRSGRGKMTPREALRELADSTHRQLDRHIFAVLRKLMGDYPPGTFVRLANRETALIARWDRHGPMPRYALSILSPTGRLMREFQARDVNRPGFGIRSYTSLDIAQMRQLAWPRIWE